MMEGFGGTVKEAPPFPRKRVKGTILSEKSPEDRLILGPGGRSIQVVREDFPMQTGDLTLKAGFGIRTVNGGLRGQNPAGISHPLAHKLIGVGKEKPHIGLGFVAFRGERAQVTGVLTGP
jgi:hypothetical protein